MTCSGFRNAGIRGGAITAGFNRFAGAGHRYSIANCGQLRSASVYRGGLPVSPNAGSYRFTDRAVSANPRFSQAASRTFFSRSQQSFGGSARPGVQFACQQWMAAFWVASAAAPRAQQSIYD